MDDNNKRFTLRIDYDIFAKIKEKAKLNKRSIGKEIEYRLEQSLQKKPITVAKA